jgi:RimJ/RimL family protein N-acetyltransferase
MRPWEHADAEALFDLYRRWEVSRWLGTTPRAAGSVDEMHARVDRWAALAQRAYGLWAVVPDEVGAPVGTVLLVPLQDGAGRPVDEVEVGWHLHPDHWGHGYATEAGRWAVERGRDAGLGEVYAVVHPGNTASVAVTRRLDMSPLGRTDRWYGVEMDAFVRRYQGP